MMKCYRLVFGVIIIVYICVIKTTIQIELNGNKNCQLDSGQMTLDLNQLYKPEGYVTTAKKSEKYIINICGEVKQCGENVVACKINTTGSLIPIALADNWIISHRNLIYKHMEKRTVQISLLCDYSLLEPKIDVLSLNGKHGMKLTFASSYLCFPEPTICKIELDGTEIDISSLYRDKNWKVKNDISHDQIYLNLCGPMNPINKYPGCTENGTKVCLLTNTEGISLNLGSSSSELSGNKDLNGLSLSFSGGYICQANKNTVTKIAFTCDFDEKGPMLISNTDCEYVIHWRTPSACPHYVSKSNNCLINDNLFNEHNYRITSSMDQEDTLPNNKVIKYNICDNLKTACNKNGTDVSFCLLQNKTEIILGISNNSVHSRDGLLTMQMTGENCGLFKKYNVLVTFICDYTKNKPTQFKFSEDLCTVNVTIFTNQVCKEPNPQNVECITETNKSGKYFNLTGLQLKDNNYEVDDYKNNVTYILNMCQPVVFSPTTLCGGVICERNNSEPDISKRFLDLGILNNFKINDDQNTLSAEMDGALCKGKYGNSHKVFLKFVCADENMIKLESSENCTHKFIWETMYACPIQNDTDLHQPKINQEPVHTKSIDKSEDTGQNNSILKETNLGMQESDAKIKPGKHSFIPSAKVVTKTITQKVRLELRTTTEKLPTITESNVITLSVPIQVSNTTGLYINNCTLANHDMPNNNYSLFLLPRNVNVTSTNGKRYSVNLCSPQKRRLTVMHLKLDNANRLVEMNLQENSHCNDASKLGFYNSVIHLKCSPELHSPQVIKETICSVQIEWKNNAACVLLESNNPEEDTLKTNGTGIPVAVPILSVFVFLCVIASIAFYLWRRKQWRNANPIFYSRGRNYVAVKDISKTV